MSRPTHCFRHDATLQGRCQRAILECASQGLVAEFASLVHDACLAYTFERWFILTYGPAHLFSLLSKITLVRIAFQHGLSFGHYRHLTHSPIDLVFKLTMPVGSSISFCDCMALEKSALLFQHRTIRLSTLHSGLQLGAADGPNKAMSVHALTIQASMLQDTVKQSIPLKNDQ